MINLEVKTVETAADAAKSDLQQVQQKYRFVPNLMGVLANSPQALKAYLDLNQLFEQTSLSNYTNHVAATPLDPPFAAAV